MTPVSTCADICRLAHLPQREINKRKGRKFYETHVALLHSALWGRVNSEGISSSCSSVPSDQGRIQSSTKGRLRGGVDAGSVHCMPAQVC